MVFPDLCVCREKSDGNYRQVCVCMLHTAFKSYNSCKKKSYFTPKMTFCLKANLIFYIQIYMNQILNIVILYYYKILKCNCIIVSCLDFIVLECLTASLFEKVVWISVAGVLPLTSAEPPFICNRATGVRGPHSQFTTQSQNAFGQQHAPMSSLSDVS